MNSQSKYVVSAIRLMINHPTLWGIVGLLFFYYIGGLLPKIGWNAIEIMIGKNLLLCDGYIVAPLDPPAIWRPMLAPFMCVLVELFTKDPKVIFQAIYTISLTTLVVTTFYISKEIWSLRAAHFCCFLVLTCPALTSFMVGGSHTFSHISFMFVIGPAILFTVLLIKEEKTLYLVLSGLFWGLTYLARPETVLYFFISFLFLIFIRYIRQRKVSECKKSVVMLILFMLVFVPYQLYCKSVRDRYNLLGQVPIITYYNSEGWARGLGGDPEASGYELSLKLYGSLESNKYSLIRAILRNPNALLYKLRLNIPKFFGFYKNKAFFNPLIFIFLPFTFFYSNALKLEWKYYFYFVLLISTSLIILIFQIDPRYLTINVPILLLLVSAGFAGFWRFLIFFSKKQIWSFRVVLIALFISFIIYNAHAAFALLNRNTYQDLSIGKELAMKFVEKIKCTDPQVLHVQLPSGSKYDGVDMFLVSYFANTAIDWGPSSIYPRDKIFSYYDKEADYEYVLEENLVKTDILLKSKPILECIDNQLGKYYLFHENLETLNLKDVSNLNEKEYKKLLAVLKKDYSTLVSLFELNVAKGEIEKTAKLTLVKNVNIDSVGCYPLALQGDGRNDSVFTMELSIPAPISVKEDYRITYIELIRENPWGINRTFSQNSILGVSLSKTDPLLNNPDGKVEIPIGKKIRLWLFAGADGCDLPSSVYWVRLKLENSLWINSPRIEFGT